MLAFTIPQLAFASYRGWLTAISYDQEGRMSQARYTQTLPDNTQKTESYDRENRRLETTYHSSASVERYDQYGRRAP
jgi:hypothetical protein